MSGPSVLDYARYYGLATDARSQNPLRLIKYNPVQDLGHADLLRDTAWPDYDEVLRDDKLQVAREAVDLLAECMKPPPSPDWASVLEDCHSTQRLKLEMPMLTSDHAKDMKWFTKGVDLQKLLRNGRETSKLESAETDGLPEILEACERHAKSITNEIQDERLETIVDVLNILRDCTRDTWKHQDLEDIINQDLKPTKPEPVRTSTPLLTATIFTEEDTAPCLPPLPQLDFEPQSEVSLEADDLLMQVERISKVEDQVCTSDVDARSPTTVRAILKEASITPPIDPVQFLAAHATAFEPTPAADQCFSPHDLKVEIPMVLSPPQSEERPKNSKRVAFKDMFEEFINFPSQEYSIAGAMLKEEEPDQQLLAKRLEQYEADVKDQIMSAKPDINDKALRVQVPKLNDVNTADPRTKTASADMVMQALSGIDIPGINSDPPTETQLNWAPIPQKLTQIDLSEHVEERLSVGQFVEKPDQILRSEQLLYKEPGLRVLDADDHDHDDEVMEEDSGLALALTGDMPGKMIPQKRHVEKSTAPGNATVEPVHQKPQSPHVSSEPSRNACVISAKVPTNHSSYDGSSRRLPSSPVAHVQENEYCLANQNDVEDLPEPIFRPKKMRFALHSPLRNTENSTDSFLAGGSLSSFLNLRGSKFKKPILTGSISQDEHDSFRSIEEMDTDPIVISQRGCRSRGGPCRPLARSGSLRQPKEHIEVPSTPNSERSVDRLIPLPKVIELAEQRTVIVDSALVNDRQLLSFLDRQGKHTLTIIYRDLHGKPSVILSPKTCILYTTYQALTQRSLPGQMPKQYISTPQQVIRHLALEYEKIFVLITVSASLEASVSDSQMNTMAAFSSFCASVDRRSPGMHVAPLWIPTEDSPADSIRENSLCSWTWALICRHAFGDMTTPSSTGKEEHIGIIQEETLWELFIRRAGMNAMAAQVILGRLKRPEGHPHNGMTVGSRLGSERTWGLGRFVSMAPEERLKLFGALVGMRTIERINGVLDFGL